jgi:hypothetical protein
VLHIPYKYFYFYLRPKEASVNTSTPISLLHKNCTADSYHIQQGNCMVKHLTHSYLDQECSQHVTDPIRENNASLYVSITSTSPSLLSYLIIPSLQFYHFSCLRLATRVWCNNGNSSARVVTQFIASYLKKQ